MIDIKIPGGYFFDGTFMSTVRLKEITGYIEHQLAEIIGQNYHRPSMISSILSCALESIDGSPMDQKVCDSLCVGDRKFLMLQLAILIDGNHTWLFPACKSCSITFDIGLHRSDLPVIEAGEGFPYAKVKIKGRMVTARVPNGFDQKWIACNNGNVTERDLLMRCIEKVEDANNTEEFLDSLNDKHVEKIEKALDAISPDVSTQLDVVCPECGKKQVVKLDPYVISNLAKSSILEHIHTIAMNYHWSYDEILRLPRSERLTYMSMIENAKGSRK